MIINSRLDPNMLYILLTIFKYLHKGNINYFWKTFWERMFIFCWNSARLPDFWHWAMPRTWHCQQSQTISNILHCFPLLYFKVWLFLFLWTQWGSRQLNILTIYLTKAKLGHSVSGGLVSNVLGKSGDVLSF